MANHALLVRLRRLCVEDHGGFRVESPRLETPGGKPRLGDLW